MTEDPSGQGSVRLAGALRRFNRALHRDLGFLCAGLTVIYCISGVAVNHAANWNANYRVDTRTATVPEVARLEGAALAARVAAELRKPGRFKNAFALAPGRTRLFYEGAVVEVDAATGGLSIEEVAERPVLYACNYLHLNYAKRWWTHVADLFALMLALLAVSGLFLVRGPTGLAGRGGWLFGAGLLVPLAGLYFCR